VPAGEDAFEVALLAIITKNFVAAAGDVEASVGTEGDALRLDEPAAAGELARKSPVSASYARTLFVSSLLT